MEIDLKVTYKPAHSPQKQEISNGSSLLLDGLRIVASVVVLMHHATQQWLVGYPYVVEQLEIAAHAAVVIFFVLSGYFIAFATVNRNSNLKRYTVARLSRLYSVLLPALLFTAIVQIVINFISPQVASYYTRGSSLPRYLLSAIFCNEIGWFSAAPPINGVLWSLSFEFWYYAIFGLILFRSSSWLSFTIIIIACVVAGPKIMLLMPIWFFGLVAFTWSRRLSLSKSWFCVSIILMITVALIIYLPPIPFKIGFKPFFLANQFVKDWLIGICVALALLHLPEKSYDISERLVKVIRHIANLSFPLYLLHYPTLVLWQAVFGRDANNILQMCIASIFAIMISVLLGNELEKRRLFWVMVIEKIIAKCKLGMDS